MYKHLEQFLAHSKCRREFFYPSRSFSWTENSIRMRQVNRRKKTILLHALGDPVMKLRTKEMTKAGSFYTFRQRDVNL